MTLRELIAEYETKLEHIESLLIWEESILAKTEPGEPLRITTENRLEYLEKEYDTVKGFLDDLNRVEEVK